MNEGPNFSVWQFIAVSFAIAVAPILLARVLEFLADRAVDTWLYLTLAALAIVVPLGVSAWSVFRYLSGDNELGWIGLVGIGSSIFAYYLLLQETGCPNCKALIPFRREIQENFPVYRKSTQANQQCYASPYVHIRKRRFTLERSWDLIIERTYQYYHSKYRCRTCQHEWDSTTSRLISKKEIEIEQPPAAYRDNNPA